MEDSHIARQQLSEIESRHQEVIKLEKCITEVRDIFVEIAYSIEKQVSCLVEFIISKIVIDIKINKKLQGDQLNCVEYFAGQATNNVEGGRTDLVKFERKKRRYRTVQKIPSFSSTPLSSKIYLFSLSFLAQVQNNRMHHGDSRNLLNHGNLFVIFILKLKKRKKQKICKNY